MKSLILLTALLLSSNAFATRARTVALGQIDSQNGSFYLDDDRNIFYNPAHVNHLGGKVIVETGGAGSSSFDLDSSQESTGGVFMKKGSMTYGVHLGNESNTGALLRGLVATGATTAVPKEDNTLNLFVGGESSSMNWGAGLYYEKNKDEQATNEVDSSAMAVRAGVMADKWEAFLNLGLDNSAELKGANTEFDGSLSFWLGGSFNLSDEQTLFASMKKADWDQNVAGSKAEGGYQQIYAGYACAHETSKSSRYFMDVTFRMTKVELDYESAATTDMEIKQTIVPLTIGYEVAATDWLTVRGSVTHNLMGSVEQTDVTNAKLGGQQTVINNLFGTTIGTGGNGKKTVSDSTAVAAGATLNLGNLAVDGLIGRDNATTNTGRLRLDNLFMRGAVTYSF